MEFELFDERTAERMLGAATATGGISTYLDFRHSSLTAGRLEAEMEAPQDLLTPTGNRHGGCQCHGCELVQHRYPIGLEQPGHSRGRQRAGAADRSGSPGRYGPDGS